jgi:hypothetical protein
MVDGVEAAGGHHRRTGLVWALTGLALVGAAWGLYSMVAYSKHHYGAITPDGVTYVAAINRWLAGGPIYTAMQSEPYVLTDASWGRGFVYPPTALFALLPFYWYGIGLWRVLNLVCLTVGALAIVRHERGFLSPVSISATCAFVLMNPFVWSAWANAQITPILVGGMAVAYVAPRLSGPVSSVGALVKVFPGFFVVWAFRSRGWSGVRDALIWGLVVIAATWPWFGNDWLTFGQSMRMAAPSCDVGVPDSIRCIVGEPFGQFVALALGGSIIGISSLLRSSAIAFAYLCLGITLLSPDLNWAYWILPSIGILPAVARWAPGSQRISQPDESAPERLRAQRDPDGWRGMGAPRPVHEEPTPVASLGAEASQELGARR